MRRDRQYPTYPSARATVAPDQYTAAAETVRDVQQVYFDGATILLPESALEAIELLRTRFGATVETGCGREWEFANKALAAGVAEPLVRLGDAVAAITGVAADDMVRAALEQPQDAYASWSALYFASMATH